MTEAQLLDGILQREGGYVDNAADPGGVTKFGITAKTWGLEKRMGRQATRAEMQAITEAQARDFYKRRYIDQSPFRGVAFEPLRTQLIDFSVQSGSARATRWLQRAIGLEATGIMDKRTLDAVTTYPSRLVNNALVAARLKMLDDWTDGDGRRKQFEEGVTDRALSFFLG